MLASCEIVAFVATTDAVKARTFYESTLGLHLIADEPPALVFDASGTMLRLAKVNEFAPASFTVLGWKVPNIRGTVQQLRVKGVEFQRYPGLAQDYEGIWTSPSGAQVAWFKDPDGNTLSLTQFMD
jgi:catechol 2,3-dioxygenase-like lactoylglutathione lyase family enzyme